MRGTAAATRRALLAAAPDFAAIERAVTDQPSTAAGEQALAEVARRVTAWVQARG